VVKVREKAWSVAAEKIRDKIKPGMPQPQIDAILEESNNQALSDCYGASWRERINPDGTIAECGVGSQYWLTHVATDQMAERHYAAIERYVGPAAAKAAREKTARLKGIKS